MGRTRRRKQPIVVALVHLGCPKNLVDSEKLLGRLAESGCIITAQPQAAHVVVINTCGFINQARAESRQAIAQVVALKKQGRIRAIVVAGCMVKLGQELLAARFPEVDIFLDFSQYPQIGTVVRQLARRPRNSRPVGCGALAKEQEELGVRLRVTPRHYAYLRIAEGCDNHCSYCLIPHIRGPLRSEPLETLVQQAHELVADDVRELIVIAQDTTSYGRDQGPMRLPELLRALAEVKGLQWIRLMYTHPASFSPDLIDVLASTPQIIPYLDIPVQHASDRILQRMGRRVTRQALCDLIAHLRQRIAGLVLRTSVIVGFPGEQEEDFRQLLEFVQEVRFERLGAFVYSPEKGTQAARWQQVAPQLKAQRFDELMRVQQEIAFAIAQAMVGQECQVVIDGPDGQGGWLARSYAEAPEVDPVVYVHGQAHPGKFMLVRCTRRSGYDLHARPVKVTNLATK